MLLILNLSSYCFPLLVSFLLPAPSLTSVADLYQLSSFDTVTVTKIHKLHHQEVLRHASTDFMMVTIKDQFISRGEMFHYLNSILGKWVFCGERLTSQEVRNAFPIFIRIAKTVGTIDFFLTPCIYIYFLVFRAIFDRVFVP